MADGVGLWGLRRVGSGEGPGRSFVFPLCGVDEAIGQLSQRSGTPCGSAAFGGSVRQCQALFYRLLLGLIDEEDHWYRKGAGAASTL